MPWKILKAAGVIVPVLALVVLAGAAMAAASYSLFGEAAVVSGGNPGNAAQITSDASPGWGGVEVLGVPSDPSTITALSFDFNANVSGNSGGSPRLVVSFDDGGNAQLRPLTLTAASWVTIDGMSGNNWDNNGGCGYLYATTWVGVMACHPGAAIDGMWVVNDSSWMYPGGIVVLVDNITVNAVVITFEHGNSEPGLDRYMNNPGRQQATDVGAQCGSGAGSGAFGYLGKDFNMAGGANGTQTGLNNSAVCGNRQGNLP